MDLFSVLAKLVENGVHPSIVAQVSQLRAKLTKDDSMVTETARSVITTNMSLSRTTTVTSSLV